MRRRCVFFGVFRIEWRVRPGDSRRLLSEISKGVVAYALQSPHRANESIEEELWQMQPQSMKKLR